MVASALRGEGAFTSSAVFESAVLTKAPQFLAQMGAPATAPAPARTPGGQFAATPATPTKAPDIPAPMGTAAGQIDLENMDPSLIPQSVVDQMTPAEAKAIYMRWQKRNGGFRHPFADAREAARSNSHVTAGLASAVAQALAKHSRNGGR